MKFVIESVTFESDEFGKVKAPKNDYKGSYMPSTYNMEPENIIGEVGGIIEFSHNVRCSEWASHPMPSCDSVSRIIWHRNGNKKTTFAREVNIEGLKPDYSLVTIHGDC